jgi:hypothetical protein
VIAEEIKGQGFVAMDIAAVLIYDRALSDPERAEVEAYLFNRYLQSPGAPALMTSSRTTVALSDHHDPAGLELRVLRLPDRIRLVFPELRPIGDYHLHATTDLLTLPLSAPESRVATWTRSEIEALPMTERGAVTLDYPTHADSLFFQLIMELPSGEASRELR